MKIILAAMLCSGSICLDSIQEGVKIKKIEPGECIKEKKGETCSDNTFTNDGVVFDGGEITFVREKWFMILKWTTRTETKIYDDRLKCDNALELAMSNPSDNFIEGYCRPTTNRAF